jgi:hypothetical protein
MGTPALSEPGLIANAEMTAMTATKAVSFVSTTCLCRLAKSVPRAAKSPTPYSPNDFPSRVVS